MQRVPTVFHVASTIVPLRIPSNRTLKRRNVGRITREIRERKQSQERGETAGELDFNTLSLAYPPRYSPPYVLMNNWSPPPGERPDLPFKVERTKSNLFPVYRATKNGGTRTKTVVRRASGDIEVLIKELSKVCGGKEIEIRGGTLQINGDHHEDVRRWLAGLGF